MYMLYAFFWVILRRLNFICRNFGTLCLSHLHRRIGMKDDVHHGLTQSGDFSTMMIKGLWLNLTKSTLLKLTPSASCNLNPTPPTEKLHIHRFFWRQQPTRGTLPNTQTCDIFQKSTRHLKILGAWKMTKLHTEDPQTLGASVQKFNRPGSVHPWHNVICSICHKH